MERSESFVGSDPATPVQERAAWNTGGRVTCAFS